MKNLYTLLLLTFSISIFGQVTEEARTISVGKQSAFAIDHPNADKKIVEDILENTLKEYGKVKRNRKAKEWNCAECKISMISTQPLNVYYTIEEGKNQTTSYLFFDDGTKFLSSENSDRVDAINDLNMEIFYGVKRAVIEKELEDEEDNLKDFNKDLSKLEKKETGLLDDIEDYKEKIRKAEKEIEEVLLLQEEKRMEIAKQEMNVESVKERLNKVGRK